jgi:hypothetical protein
MGDIPAGMLAHRWYLNDWFNLGSDGVTLPHLDAWYDRLCCRTSFAKVMGKIPKSYEINN